MINNKKLIFTNTLQVRIDDINFGGHLDSSRMASLLHNTRALFLDSHNQSEIDCFGVSLILLGIKMNYEKQVFFGQRLLFCLYIDSICKTKVEFSYIVKFPDTDEIVLSATASMSTYSVSHNRIVKPTSDFLSFFEQLPDINKIQ